MPQVKAALAFIRVAWPYATIAALILALMLTRETLWREKARSAGIQSAYNDFAAGVRLKTQTARADDLANVVRVGEVRSSINDKREASYAEKLHSLHNDLADCQRLWAEGKFDSRCASAADLSRVPETTCKPHEAPKQNPVLPIKDALTCSEQAIQLEELQGWINDQAAVKN